MTKAGLIKMRTSVILLAVVMPGLQYARGPAEDKTFASTDAAALALSRISLPND
jgi:hypothetical protein